MNRDLFLTASADFDESRLYRYSLVRSWDSAKPRILFVMLNPSTADEYVEDPTVRRCIVFAKDWGYGEIEVCNLFGFRATDPEQLYSIYDPVGPGNVEAICRGVERAAMVVAGWGNHGDIRGQGERIADLITARKDLYCVAKTKTGQPGHPLYIARATQPILFKPRRAS